MKEMIIAVLFFLLFASVAAEPIFLNSINISTNASRWIVNENNYLFIYTFNSTNNLTDISSIMIDVLSNLSYSQSESYRIDKGIYIVSFYLNNTNNNSFMFLNITASDRGKTVNQLYNVSLTSNDRLSDFFDTLTKYLKNTYNKFISTAEEYWLSGVIILFLLLTLLVFFDIFLRRNKT